ncbi:mannose-6-phosphate isomerase, class I [Micrococcus luteus]
MLRLDSTIRDYSWGSTTLLAALQGREPTGAPEAEMWLGAHPGDPCVAVLPDGGRIRLDELIAQDPERHLGAAARFGRLPYLMKLLAADRPLSIQAHPTLEQAQAGFAAEEASGMPSDAPDRNYRDDNHKPEMVVALTPFSALCGFRRAEESQLTFERIAQVMTEYADGDATEVAITARHLAVLLADGDVQGAFAQILDPSSLWSRGGTAELVGALKGMNDLILHDDAIVTALEAAEHFPDDPGVLVTLLLNRVDLMPGQAIHLPAGNVHAYLHGLGVEVMAASDNVLRGGLTPKHVDVPELTRVVTFDPLPVPYTTPEPAGEGVVHYRPPFEEFTLTQLTADDAQTPEPVPLSGPVIAVGTKGSADVACGGERTVLAPGEAVFLSAAQTAEAPLEVRSADGEAATVHVASLPED